MLCNVEKWHFFNFNTDSRIRLCVMAHYLMYVQGKHQGHQIAFSDFQNFVFVRKNDFAEFKVHLIHRKRVPLLHNKVFILCISEGAGLVAMIYVDTIIMEVFIL